MPCKNCEELKKAYEEYMRAEAIEDSEEAYYRFVRICERILAVKQL